jgi:hypothetical protein
MKIRFSALIVFLLFFSSVTAQSSFTGEQVRRILEEAEDPFYDIGQLSYTSRNLPEHFIASAEPYQRDLKRVLIDGPQNIKALPLQSTGQNVLGMLLTLEGIVGDAIIYRADSFDPVRVVKLDGTPRQLFLGFEMSQMVLVFEVPESGDYTIGSQQAYILDPSVVTTNRSIGFCSNLPCHVDVSCPEGKDFVSVQQGVTRIFMVLVEGIGFCTGAFMNNTAEDKTPYILTAYHCYDGFTPIWDEFRFEVGLASISCDPQVVSPAVRDLYGAEEVAGRQNDDFVLLRLTSPIPDNLSVAFLGWDRTSQYFPDTAVLIHHPQGDLRKISFNFDKLESNRNPIFWNNGVESAPNSHYMCNFELGTHENGSSGGPFIDTKGHVIGQLHGGQTACDNRLAFAGRLSRAWNGPDPTKRLSDWLDPLGTGQMMMDQLDGDRPSGIQLVSGIVLTANDEVVPNVMVNLSGTNNGMMTGMDGMFSFEFFNNGFTGNLSARKTGDPKNGTNILDLIIMLKHIVGLESFDNPLQEVAGDVNQDGSVNILDVIVIQKVIASLEDSFPNDLVWTFYPSPLELQDGDNTQVVIRAVKLGDLDFSADPNQ